MSGNDCLNSVCFSCCRKADNELADVTLSNSLFQNCAAATGNARSIADGWQFERRNPQTVWSGRAECWSTRQVSDMDQRTEADRSHSEFVMSTTDRITFSKKYNLFSSHMWSYIVQLCGCPSPYPSDRHQLTLRDHRYADSASGGACCHCCVFSPHVSLVTHCANPECDGQAELTCVAQWLPNWFTRQQPSKTEAERAYNSWATLQKA